MVQRVSSLEKALAEDDTATGILISDFEVGIVDGKYSIEQVEDFTNEQLALGNITRDTVSYTHLTLPTNREV